MSDEKLLLALKDFIEELIGILVFQPDIPYQHKQDLVDAGYKLTNLIQKRITKAEAQ